MSSKKLVLTNDDIASFVKIVRENKAEIIKDREHYLSDKDDKTIACYFFNYEYNITAPFALIYFINLAHRKKLPRLFNEQVDRLLELNKKIKSN